MATTVTLKPNAIDISGSTSGTTTLQATAVAGTTTLTLPAATDTLVGKATTDTLTNKTLTSPTITGGALNGTVGATTPATGAFTTLSASGNVTLGDASTDTLNVGNGGLIKDASGNLGLGVTPSAWFATSRILQIGSGGAIESRTNFEPYISTTSNAYLDTAGVYRYIGSAEAGRYLQSSGVHSWYTAASGTAGDPIITFTQAMTLDASGNLGIGTTAPLGLLNIKGSNGQLVLNNGASSGGVRLSAFTNAGTANGYLAFEGYSSEYGRFDSSGNLLVGTTDSAQGSGVGNKFLNTGAVWVVNAATSDAFSYYNTSASAYRFYVSAGGTISATNTTISAISDIRFKENIRDLNVGLSEIIALKPRLYDWKEGKGADIKNARGFIAQEFETVFPDLIDEWKDPAPEGEEPYKAVNANLIPTLVKAIQELKMEFDAYKATHP